MDRFFTRFCSGIATAAGQPLAFTLALLLMIVWGATGPIFHYSDTWQLVVNTATTIVTFLMVFLIQNSQNREGQALQAKLDEVIRALDKAENRFIALEQRPEKEILEMRKESADETSGAAGEVRMNMAALAS